MQRVPGLGGATVGYAYRYEVADLWQIDQDIVRPQEGSLIGVALDVRPGHQATGTMGDDVHGSQGRKIGVIGMPAFGRLLEPVNEVVGPILKDPVLLDLPDMAKQPVNLS